MGQNGAEKKLSSRQEKVAADVAADVLTNEQIARKWKIGTTTLDRWKAMPHFAAKVDEVIEAARQAARQNSIANKVLRVDALINRQSLMRQVIDERAAWYKEHAPDVPGGKTGLMVHGIKFVKVYDVDTKAMARKQTRWTPKVGDKVEVLDEGLANLRGMFPDEPPNHHGVIEEIWMDGALLILFDDTKQSAPYPRKDVRPRSKEDDEILYPSKIVRPVQEHGIDIALLKEMRGTEQQIAIELGEWTEKRETTGASINLDLSLLDDEQLNEYGRLIDAGNEPARAYLLARKGKA